MVVALVGVQGVTSTILSTMRRQKRQCHVATALRRAGIRTMPAVLVADLSRLSYQDFWLATKRQLTAKICRLRWGADWMLVGAVHTSALHI